MSDKRCKSCAKIAKQQNKTNASRQLFLRHLKKLDQFNGFNFPLGESHLWVSSFKWDQYNAQWLIMASGEKGKSIHDGVNAVEVEGDNGEVLIHKLPGVDHDHVAEHKILTETFVKEDRTLHRLADLQRLSLVTDPGHLDYRPNPFNKSKICHISRKIDLFQLFQCVKFLLKI